MTRMGTTTYRNRNEAQIQAARYWAVKCGMKSPAILDIGPGGRVAFLSRQGETRQKCPLFVESAIRKSGIFRLKTFEPAEILEAFSGLTPKSMHIVDKEQSIIRSVRKEMERNSSAVKFEYSVCKVEEFNPHAQFDIVFAYNVIQRTVDWRASLYRIADLVNVNGILSITYDTKLGRRSDLTESNVDSFLTIFTRLDSMTYMRNV